MLHILNAKILQFRKPVIYLTSKKSFQFLLKIYNGVIHAGDLLAQHPVVISASVCLYPLKISIFGEVGEKTTRKYLKKKSNLFQSVEEVSYYSATLLRALSLYNNKTIMFCENLVCKYIQTLFTAANNKCKY